MAAQTRLPAMTKQTFEKTFKNAPHPRACPQIPRHKIHKRTNRTTHVCALSRNPLGKMLDNGMRPHTICANGRAYAKGTNENKYNSYATPFAVTANAAPQAKNKSVDRNDVARSTDTTVMDQLLGIRIQIYTYLRFGEFHVDMRACEHQTITHSPPHPDTTTTPTPLSISPAFPLSSTISLFPSSRVPHMTAWPPLIESKCGVLARLLQFVNSNLFKGCRIS